MRRIRCTTCGSRAGRAATRAGLALLVVLVSLAIVSAIATSLLRLSLMHHKQAAREVFAAQSRWLVESGLDRAVMQLRANPKFEGVTWSVPAEKLDGHHAAEVVIKVSTPEDAPQRREIDIGADFPATGWQRTRTRVVRQLEL